MLMLFELRLLGNPISYNVQGYKLYITAMRHDSSERFASYPERIDGDGTRSFEHYFLETLVIGTTSILGR